MQLAEQTDKSYITLFLTGRIKSTINIRLNISKVVLNNNHYSGFKSLKQIQILYINHLLTIKNILMNDLLKTSFFILLAETSPKVASTEIQDAYEKFVKCVLGISNSEDYSDIFRTLNLTRIEIAALSKLQQYELEKKCA